MLELSARELGLLEVLLQRTGRLVSKEQLVDHLCEWGEEVSNNAIEVYVHRLRKKIEVGGVRIATVRDSAIAWRNCPRTALPRWRPNAARGRVRLRFWPASRALIHDRARSLPRCLPPPPPEAAAPLARPPPHRKTPRRPRHATGERIQRSLFGDPRLDAGPAAAAVADEHRHHLPGRQSIANQPFDHALEDSVTVLAQQVLGSTARWWRACRSRHATCCAPTTSTTSTTRSPAPVANMSKATSTCATARRGRPHHPGHSAFRNDILHGSDVRIATLQVDLRRSAAQRGPARAAHCHGAGGRNAGKTRAAGQ
jgi:hypothetical protein